IGKQAWYLFTSPILQRRRRRAVAVTGAILGGAAGILLLVPVPYFTVTEGVVWTPDESTVHAGASGIVAELLAEPNAYVSAGDPLIRLEDEFLDSRVKVLESQVAELRLRYEERDTVDPVEAR